MKFIERSINTVIRQKPASLSQKEISSRSLERPAKSATHPLRRRILQTLKKLVGRTPHRVKVKTHFIREIEIMKLDSNDILVSFDVRTRMSKLIFLVNVDMETYKITELKSVHLKYKLQLKYVMDTGITRSHGQHTIKEFYYHLNSSYTTSQIQW